MTKLPKLSEIKTANQAIGEHFFDRDTMQFWGDTMASFKVRDDRGSIIIERVKQPRRAASQAQVGTRWRFDSETGRINYLSSPPAQAAG